MWHNMQFCFFLITCYTPHHDIYYEMLQTYTSNMLYVTHLIIEWYKIMSYANKYCNTIFLLYISMCYILQLGKTIYNCYIPHTIQLTRRPRADQPEGHMQLRRTTWLCPGRRDGARDRQSLALSLSAQSESRRAAA